MMRKNLYKFLIAAVTVLPQTAFALPYNLDFDFRNFACAGCYEASLSNAPAGPNPYSDNGIGSAFYTTTGEFRRLQDDRAHLRPVLFESILAGSKIYLDVENSAVYLTADLQGQITATPWRGTRIDLNDTRFNQPAQLFYAFTEGVEIITNANGVPIDFRVSGMSANNGGYIVWDNNQFAETFTAKPGGPNGESLTFEDGILSNWFMFELFNLYANGTINSGYGTATGLADFQLQVGHFTRPHTEVPEPSTALLLLAGSAALMQRRKRQ